MFGSEMPVAGVTTKLGSETTEECLRLAGRPSTPPEVKKWRKSNYAEPGRRVIHPGMIDDFAGREAQHPKFGKIKVESDHVEDVWRQPGAESEYTQVKLNEKEALYHSTKREPLGKTYSRGHALPAETNGRDFAFGMKSQDSTDASKSLIYAPSEVADAAMTAQYIKSHGSFAPGEQRRRGYDWGGVDLTAHRFGVGDGSHVALNGLAIGAVGAIRAEEDADPITSTRVQNFKNLQDKLGRGRYLGHGPKPNVGDNHSFGKASIRGFGEWDAHDCIQGAYSAAEQDPDEDLGKTHTPGFRNDPSSTVLKPGQLAADRTFGTPTIRSDIAKYERRSIADQQNYGDDASAQSLLYPSTLVALGLDENEFALPRTKDDILAIFSAIPHGTNLTEAQMAALYDDCAEQSTSGLVSIDFFRRKALEKTVTHFRNDLAARPY